MTADELPELERLQRDTAKALTANAANLQTIVAAYRRMSGAIDGLADGEKIFMLQGVRGSPRRAFVERAVTLLDQTADQLGNITKLLEHMADGTREVVERHELRRGG